MGFLSFDDDHESSRKMKDHAAVYESLSQFFNSFGRFGNELRIVGKWRTDVFALAYSVE